MRITLQVAKEHTKSRGPTRSRIRARQPISSAAMHPCVKRPHLENVMSSPILHGRQPGTFEPRSRSLSDTSKTPPWKVRALFNAEPARPQMGAKVGSYLAVLTEANARGMLRRKKKSAADVAANDEAERFPPSIVR